MKIEVKVTKKEEFEQIRKLPIHRVGIGDEFCPYRFPVKEEMTSIIQACEDDGIEWSIITPFMSNRSIEFFWDILDDLTRMYHEVNIVVNDYGFLENLAVKYPDATFNIGIGHMLAHSYEESPWHEIELADENSFIRDHWILNTFHNKNVLEFFKANYNMKEIRLNCLTESIKNASYFIDSGLNVVFSEKYYAASIARNCHTARFNKITASRECNGLCNDFYKIENRKLHKILPDGESYADPDLGMEIPAFYVAGNVVFKDYTNDYLLPEHEKVIASIDYRFYKNREDIQKRVEELQGGGVLNETKSAC